MPSYFSSELTRFLIFASIGLFNSVLDTVIWRILVWLLDKKPELVAYIHKFVRINKYAIAQLISFILSATSSYFLNSTFTFSDSGSRHDLWQVFRFFAVASISLSLSVFIINFLTENKTVLSFVRKFPPILLKHWPLAAKILTIAVTMVTNFVGYKLLVF